MPPPPFTHPLPHVKALVFDVFGTCTDWRTSISAAIRAAAAHALAANPSIPPTTRAAAQSTTPDWPAALAVAWRQSYYDYVRGVAAADPPPTTPKNIDAHHLDALRRLLPQFGLAGLFTEPQTVALSRAWHALDGWADVPAGIRALNAAGYTTATLSNGNVELLRDMAAHAGFEWTAVLSADMFGSFKPSPAVYRGAAERLGLRTGEVAMVASHLNDLEAARGCGLHAIYTARPGEEAWDAERVERARAEGWVEIWVEQGADELPEVARRLAALRAG